jgi:hypothetical protein
MTIRKFGLAVCLLLGVAGSTLVVWPALAQQPNPEAKPWELVVFGLKHANAAEVSRVLSDLYGINSNDPRVSTIRVAVDPRANSVVVSAPSSRIDEIRALIARLEDSPLNAASQRHLRVFPLHFAEPDKALESALQLVMPENGQFTIDRVRKQIIISTKDDAVLKQAEELLARLDQAPAMRSTDDVQVRIVWLVQGRTEDFGPPPDDIKDVVPALAKLGIEKPRLAAQTIVNATPSTQFSASGTVKLGESVQLSVTGQYVDRPDAASLQITIHARNPGGVICDLSTNISAPMRHLVVLGVTPTRDMSSIFVVQVLRNGAKPVKP